MIGVSELTCAEGSVGVPDSNAVCTIAEGLDLNEGVLDVVG